MLLARRLNSGAVKQACLQDSEALNEGAEACVFTEKFNYQYNYTSVQNELLLSESLISELHDLLMRMFLQPSDVRLGALYD